jgi:hypothetical protein
MGARHGGLSRIQQVGRRPVFERSPPGSRRFEYYASALACGVGRVDLKLCRSILEYGQTIASITQVFQGDPESSRCQLDFLLSYTLLRLGELVKGPLEIGFGTLDICLLTCAGCLDILSGKLAHRFTLA